MFHDKNLHVTTENFSSLGPPSLFLLHFYPYFHLPFHLKNNIIQSFQKTSIRKQQLFLHSRSGCFSIKNSFLSVSKLHLCFLLLYHLYYNLVYILTNYPNFFRFKSNNIQFFSENRIGKQRPSHQQCRGCFQIKLSSFISLNSVPFPLLYLLYLLSLLTQNIFINSNLLFSSSVTNLTISSPIPLKIPSLEVSFHSFFLLSR